MDPKQTHYETSFRRAELFQWSYRVIPPGPRREWDGPCAEILYKGAYYEFVYADPDGYYTLDGVVSNGVPLQEFFEEYVRIWH